MPGEACAALDLHLCTPAMVSMLYASSLHPSKHYYDSCDVDHELILRSHNVVSSDSVAALLHIPSLASWNRLATSFLCHELRVVPCPVQRESRWHSVHTDVGDHPSFSWLETSPCRSNCHKVLCNVALVIIFPESILLTAPSSTTVSSY